MSLVEHHASSTRSNRCRRCGIVIGYGDRCDWCSARPLAHRDAPGEYEGRHHTEWIGTVQVLLDEHDLITAEMLLRRLQDAAAAEARTTGRAPYPWYSERLMSVEARAHSALGGSVTTPHYS